MAFGFDIFGVVTGALGLFGLVPLLYVMLYSQLPSRKLKQLDEALEETASLWRSAIEEGLFCGTRYATTMGDWLHHLRVRSDELRAESHSAASFVQELKAMQQGLSKKIAMLCNQVKRTRAKISSTTAEERKRLERDSDHVHPEIPSDFLSDIHNFISPHTLVVTETRTTHHCHLHDVERMTVVFCGASDTVVDRQTPEEIVLPRLAQSDELAETFECSASEISGTAKPLSETIVQVPSRPEATARVATSESTHRKRGSRSLGGFTKRPYITRATLFKVLRHVERELMSYGRRLRVQPASTVAISTTRRTRKFAPGQVWERGYTGSRQTSADGLLWSAGEDDDGSAGWEDDDDKFEPMVFLGPIRAPHM